MSEVSYNETTTAETVHMKTYNTEHEYIKFGLFEDATWTLEVNTTRTPYVAALSLPMKPHPKKNLSLPPEPDTRDS